ncbi:MAG TPA: FHA domain-containing protein [Kofleriaceae bacterium]|nr:FHA domain-containing protein [Kofleriaceae bacterium]
MLSYALAGVGLLLAVYSAWAVMKRSLKHRAANPMFVKFATTGRVETMRKLCRAPGVKGTYLDAIDAAVVAGLAAKTQDAAANEAAVEGAYDRVSLEVAKAWKGFVDRGLIGAIVAIAGLGLAASEGDVQRPLLLLSGIAAAAGGLLLTKRNDMVEALLESREAVLPSLIAGLSGGVAATADTATPSPATPAPSTAKDEPLAPGTLRLRILRDDALVRSQTLDQKVSKIGRIASAHVHLDHADVSRMHAVIENSDEGAWVIDLGSSIGTIVNGEKVNKKTLRAGDVIDIGPFRLEVELGELAPRAN